MKELLKNVSTWWPMATTSMNSANSNLSSSFARSMGYQNMVKKNNTLWNMLEGGRRTRYNITTALISTWFSDCKIWFLSFGRSADQQKKHFFLPSLTYLIICFVRVGLWTGRMENPPYLFRWQVEWNFQSITWKSTDRMEFVSWKE